MLKCRQINKTLTKNKNENKDEIKVNIQHTFSHLKEIFLGNICRVYIPLLPGEVNTGQFRYSDWLLSGQYSTVKTTPCIFRTTNIIKTKKKLSPVNKYNNSWLVGPYGKY